MWNLRPKTALRAGAVVLLATCVAAVPLFAEVKAQLTARKVVRAGNQETYQLAEQAKPGDTIEYTAVYTNTEKAQVRDVLASLPIPAGMVYIPDSAQPKPVAASIDGKTFENVPLMRTVKTADGKTVSQPVPISEYRFLRWNLGEIPGGGSKKVSARVLITPVPAHK